MAKKGRAGKREAKTARRLTQELQRRLKAAVRFDVAKSAANVAGSATAAGGAATVAARTASTGNPFLAGLGGKVAGEAVEQAGNPKGLARITNLFKGAGGKGALTGIAGGLIAPLMIDAILGAINESRGEGIQIELQDRALDIQESAVDSDQFLLDAILPSSEAQKQQAMSALMATLTEGNSRPRLARGEIYT